MLRNIYTQRYSFLALSLSSLYQTFHHILNGDSAMKKPHSSGTRWMIIVILCLTVTIIVLGAVVGVFAALVAPILRKNSSSASTASKSVRFRPLPSLDESRCQQAFEWRDTVCCPNRQCKKSWRKNAVLLVSMDGFRADYLKQNRTSALHRLMDCGSHAPFMYPSYPSITFPNHYAIVTGLYPESHGIVDNHMYDPTIRPVADSRFGRGKPGSFNPQWWLGEPVSNELMVVDSTINYLMRQLFEHELSDCVNIILVADHGMQKVYEDPSTKIFLDQYFDVSRTVSFDGPVGRIMLNSSGISKEAVINNMKCKNESFRVYAKEDVPKRLHLSRNPRIGDIVVDTNPGYEVKLTNDGLEGRQGEHGYDFRFNSMHAIFIANGPDIKRSFTVPPFQNVEIFNLMSNLLDIRNPPPNNGTVGSLRSVMRTPPYSPPRRFPPLSQCQLRNTQLIACSSCNTFLATPNLAAPCPETTSIIATLRDQSRNVCQLLGCSTPLVYDFELGYPKIEQSWIYGDTQLDTPTNFDCSYTINSFVDCSRYRNIQAAANGQRMDLTPLLTSNSTIMQLYFQKMPMYRQFATRWLHPGALQMGHLCPQQEYAQVLSFILPHRQQPENCQSTMEYFYTHTGRVRDIELLTGLQFFENRVEWELQTALRLRIHVNQRLWDRF